MIAAVRDARGSVGLARMTASALGMLNPAPHQRRPQVPAAHRSRRSLDPPARRGAAHDPSLSTESPGLAVGTAQGVAGGHDYPGHRDELRRSWRRRGRRARSSSPTGQEDLVLRHLRRPAAAVLRNRCRPAGAGCWWRGLGLKLAAGRRGAWRRGPPRAVPQLVVTSKCSRGAARHRAWLAEGHPVRRVPGQGPRPPGASGGTGSARDTARVGWVGAAPARAAAANGRAPGPTLPVATCKRGRLRCYAATADVAAVARCLQPVVDVERTTTTSPAAGDALGERPTRPGAGPPCAQPARRARARPSGPG